MGLTTLLAQLFFTFFKVKLWKVVTKCKNVFLNFRVLFLLKMFIFEVLVSSLAKFLSNQLIFEVLVSFLAEFLSNQLIFEVLVSFLAKFLSNQLIFL